MNITLIAEHASPQSTPEGIDWGGRLRRAVPQAMPAMERRVVA